MLVRRFMSTRAVNRVNILFCNKGSFNSASALTAAAVVNDPRIEVRSATQEELADELPRAHIVVPFMTRIGAEQLAMATSLRTILQFGVGLEGVDIPAATRAGVWVAPIPSADNGNAQSCAEHAIFLALSVLRDINGIRTSLKTHRIGTPTGRTLMGSTAVIYGYGAIGRHLLRRLVAFDMKKIFVVQRTSRTPQEDFERLANVEFGSVADFHERFAASTDIVFLCCSQNASNIGLVNKTFLDSLKPKSIVVNVARVSQKKQS